MKRQYWLTIILISIGAYVSAVDDDSANFDLSAFEDPIAEVVAPSPLPMQGEAGIVLDLPLFGALKLYPYVDAKSGKKGLSVKSPPPDKQLSLGPLAIKNGEFTLVDNKISYGADATLFGSGVRIVLRDVSKAQESPKEKSYVKMTLGVDFLPGQKPKFELLRGAPFIVVSADAVIEKKQPIQVIVRSTLADVPVDGIFTVGKLSTDVAVAVPAMPLVKFFPQAKNTPLEQAELSQFSVTINNFISREKPPRKAVVSFVGKVDLSAIPGLDSPDAKTMAISGSFDTSANAILFEATASQLALPSVGTIHQAKVTGMLGKANSIKLQGELELDLGFGPFKATLDSAISKNGVEFAGEIKQNISFDGVTLSNPKVSFSSITKTVSVVGEANIQGYVTRLSINRDAHGNLVAEGSMGDKPIKPFGALNIPGFSDVEIRNPHLLLQQPGAKKKKGAGLEFVTEGDITLFGATLHGNLHLLEVQNRTISVLDIAGQPQWKISNAVPSLRGTLFDSFELSNLHFVITSDTYTDNERQLTFRKGLNFYAQTTLTGPLAPVASLTGNCPASIILGGHLSEDPRECVFTAQIPCGMNLKSQSVKIGKLALEVSGNPEPALSLLTTLQFTAPKSDPLQFTIRLEVGPLDALGAGTLTGFWNNPLGVQGLQIGDVALQVGVNYALLASTGVPSEVGIAGSVVVGKKHVSVAGKMNVVHEDQFVIAGSLDQLSLEDIAEFAARIIKRSIAVDRLPAIEVRNLELYVVPENTTIGELVFQQGLRLSAEFIVPGFTGAGYARIETSGVEIHAYCSPISFGPLKIKRSLKEKTSNERQAMKEGVVAAQDAVHKAVEEVQSANAQLDQATQKLAQVNTLDQKKQASDALKKVAQNNTVLQKAIAERERLFNVLNGPIMSVTLTPSKQGLLVSGEFSIDNVLSQDTYFTMSADGIEFDFEAALGNDMYENKPLLYGHITGKSMGSLANPDFAVTIDFGQTLQKFLTNQINVNMVQAQKKIEEDINKALQSVQSLDGVIAEVRQKTSDAEKVVQRASQEVNAINGAIAESDHALQKAQNDVHSLQSKIDEAQQEIDQAKKEFNSMSKLKQATYGWAEAGGKITAAGVKLAGLQTAKAAADGFLEGLKQISKGTLVAARDVAQGALKASEEFLHVVGKGTAEGVLNAARDSGKSILESVEKSTVGVLQGGRFITTKLLTAIDVQKLHYDGHLQELASGKLGRVTCALQIFDKNVDLLFDLNIRSAAESMKGLAHQVVDHALKPSQDLNKQVQLFRTSEAKVQKVLQASRNVNLNDFEKTMENAQKVRSKFNKVASVKAH